MTFLMDEAHLPTTAVLPDGAPPATPDVDDPDDDLESVAELLDAAPAEPTSVGRVVFDLSDDLPEDIPLRSTGAQDSDQEHNPKSDAGQSTADLIDEVADACHES